MKILCASNDGGNFYASLAIAESIEGLSQEKKLARLRLYYASDSPHDEVALYESHIKFVRFNLGIKKNRFWAWKNFVQALWRLFLIFPDVVVSTGDQRIMPIIRAARWLKIPIFHHVNKATTSSFDLNVAKIARRVSTTYPQAAEEILGVSSAVAATGHPIRPSILKPIREGAQEYLKLEPDTPTILVLGGASGSELLNHAILDLAFELVPKFQLLHQTGDDYLDDTRQEMRINLENSPFIDHYQLYGFLDPLALRMAAGIADIVICPMGSIMHEVSAWGLPAIIIPTEEDTEEYRQALASAYEYAESGAAVVIEQTNLHPHVLLSELERIINDPKRWKTMAAASRGEARPEASRLIAEEILYLAGVHDSF